MDSESLSYKTLKNASYTFINYVVPIVFSVFITPVVVHKLGVVDYGVFILVGTINAFLALLDLGLGVALVKYISQYQAEGNFEGLKNLLNSAYSLYFIIGIFGFLVYFILGKFFLPIFHIVNQSEGHILIVFLLSGALFFISSISNLYGIVPAAMQRFDITTKISLGQLTIFNLGILIAVLLGYKLKVILLLNVITSFGMTLVFRAKFKQLMPKIKLRLAWSKAEIIKAYRFGLLAAANNLASSSLIQLDRFIIPIFLGPAALSYYSLPGNVAQKTAGVTNSAAGVVFPLASAMEGTGETERLKGIYLRVMRNVTIVAAGCTMAIIAFAYPILFYWLGKDFADKGWQILIILAATYFLLAIYNSLSYFLLGLNKLKFLLSVSIFLALLNLGLLLAFIPKMGILGAAWAYLGGVLPIPFIIYWAEKKYFGLVSQGKFYLKLYSKLLVTSAAFYLLGHFFISRLVVNFTSLVIVGPLVVLFYFFLYWLLGFMEPEDRTVLNGFLLKIKEKFLKSNAQ